ncbi:glycosyltransferase family 39 protein [Chloroflexus aggregans]|uniref:Membrane protein-like protein n=1 Tax=Chloroflexus aggregans (strain MD-66 / DSM 9485) TaxID=326427 RepID=B8G5I3_CHLAD|nr:glycosyltransferase family 39 protein [Chloroflexus aggregans]ACL25689.1 membrane protein-like protein [Chloroflexus aggregans DSM 9485]
MRWSWSVFFILSGLAALVLRLYRLDAQSLWLDEGNSWAMAMQPWSVLVLDLVQPNAAYPLYHLLLKAWMAVAGTSEWALRLPSALAGALSVPLLALAARAAAPTDRRRAIVTVAATLIGMWSPFALWYAQEAKVYALVLLVSAAMLWLTLRAVQHDRTADWGWLFGLAIVAFFIHRLTALLTLSAALIWLFSRPRRYAWLIAAGLLLIGVGMIAAMAAGIGSDRAASGASIAADPLRALWLTFTRFSLDRWPGDVPWVWCVPWLVLMVLGLIVVRTVSQRTAPVLGIMGGVPLLLFSLQLVFTRLYEARYLMIIFPVWVVVLALGLAPQRGGSGWRSATVIGSLALSGVLITGGLSLFQPRFGLFSGDPVKEQYREAITELARRLHPDDAVVVHPGYLRPLYDYYMARLSADPAPSPLTFANFWMGETGYSQRDWDAERRVALAGYTRSFLVIAPNHARTVDPPLPGDEYGLVGNFWAFSREQRTWPCGIWRFQGVHLFCQEAPEAYITGAIIEPVTPVTATFGDDLMLLGYTLKATTPAGPGVYRAGGNIPLSLFWDVRRPLAEDYSLFIHLCRDCEQPPVAGDDGQPLAGYLPTSTWLPGKPARDDRAIHIPHDLPPGEYQLLIGWYRPTDPSPEGRLPVRGEGALGAGRLWLATIEIIGDDEGRRGDTDALARTSLSQLGSPSRYKIVVDVWHHQRAYLSR